MAAPICSVFALCLAGAVIFLSAGSGSAGSTRPGSNATAACGGGWSRVGSCPATCFSPDPVCGVNGVTYWCGCGDAACEGIEVARLGFCEVEKGGAGPQVMLLIHIVWLIVVGFSLVLGVF